MIVNCAIYRDGKKLRDVELDQISEALEADPACFVWLGLHEPDIAELRKMQSEFGLHDLAIEDALNAHQRPKIEVYGETLFIVLGTVQLVENETLFGETHLFLGDRFVVSVRHGASTAYTELRKKCEMAPELMKFGPTYVVYAIADFVVDRFEVVTDHMEQRFEVLERQIFNEHFDRAAIERLYELKSQLLRLRGVVLPVQDICSQLTRLQERHVPKPLRAYFRDVEDHASRVIGVLDVIREMLTTAIQVNLALVGVGQNEIAKKLAGSAAILAVPTVVFGWYGMNFQFMPELHWHYAYPVVMGMTAAICAGIYTRLRRVGWL